MMHGIARQVAVVSLVILAGAPTHAAEPTAEPTESDRATATHSFADVKYWSSIFDDPRRDEWQKPQALVDALQVRPGMTVADLGAGTGYFSRYLSAAVGPQGAVLAIEIEPTLLTHLRERAEREHSDNLVPLLASADNPRLPSAGVDLILIADTYHHLDHRMRYLPLLRRALRSAGRIAVVDWKAGELPQGPPPEHKLARERVIEEMTGAGFVLVGEPDLLPYHYVLIFAVR